MTPDDPCRVRLAVAGAHLSGQPLNHQLTERGATLLAVTHTAPSYRLHALDTVPPKPGLVRVGPGEPGHEIEVEVWVLTPEAFGTFVDGVPSPLGIGRITLRDGSEVAGFICEPFALDGAPDVSQHGGWRAYLAAGAGEA